jgi:hypothetical protein
VSVAFTRTPKLSSTSGKPCLIDSSSVSTFLAGEQDLTPGISATVSANSSEILEIMMRPGLVETLP